MAYNTCCVCGLVLPSSIIQPIKVKHQGKIIIVGICNICKERKEADAKKEKI